MFYMSVLLLLFANCKHHKRREGKALGCSFAVLISGPVRDPCLQVTAELTAESWEGLGQTPQCPNTRKTDARPFHRLFYPLSSLLSPPCLYSPAIQLLV